MSQLPSDLTFRVGQDYTLRQLFRAAWAQCRRNFWPATGYFLLASLMCWTDFRSLGELSQGLSSPLIPWTS